MNPFVRFGGVATLADGSEVVWSVADGGRGRRWRAMTKRRGSMVASLLLEVAPDGHPVRLELATNAGLLTLHPEATGSLHGNAVTAAGVRHLTLPWSDEHELEVEPRAIAGAVSAARLADRVAVGDGTDVPVVIVSADLTVREATRRYERVDELFWRIDGDDATRLIVVDERGVLAWARGAGESAGERDLAAPRTWPLEQDPPG